MFAKTLAFAGLAAVASAHQTMVNPSPFAGTISSPLDPSGSNFPCQAVAYTSTGSNTWALGSKQTLETMGSAVHGGGSAQFSITYDTNPTANSQWKVIHTVQGGMPARGLNDNRFPTDPTLPNPDTYDFTVPSNLPAGDVVFSWSWINRLGNREFYMFCAPVTLTGTGGDASNFDALPDMVILNIMDKAQVTSGSDVEFANPGTSVENNIGKYGFESELCCAAGCGESVCTRSEGGSDTPSDPTTAPTTAAPIPTATTIPGGVFITQPITTETTAPAAPTTTAPVVVPTTAPTTTTTADVQIPTSTIVPIAAPSQGTGSGSGALSGACSPEGQWNCVDGSSFQQCGSGIWSTVMALAEGTSCSVGQSSTLSMSATRRNSKRAVRAFRA